MKSKMIHHGYEWLDGNFEPPSAFSESECIRVLRRHSSRSTAMVAMKLEGVGTAVWNQDGKLLREFKHGADLVFVDGEPGQLLSLENQFGKCQNETGVGHILRRINVTDFQPVEELEICVPTGGVEFLVADHCGNHCLATWLDQAEWGYVVVDLQKMVQLSGGLTRPSPSMSPPEFAPDDAVVVACSPYQDGWWTDEVDDYWEYESPGGLRKMGTISVHDLSSNSLTHHDVVVELPKGWIPERADMAEWQAMWGPQFTSPDEFLIWLPDDSVEQLKLPLPPHIEIHREIDTRREVYDEG